LRARQGEGLSVHLFCIQHVTSVDILGHSGCKQGLRSLCQRVHVA
jgi:hypothetical protein